MNGIVRFVWRIKVIEGLGRLPCRIMFEREDIGSMFVMLFYVYDHVAWGFILWDVQ